MQEEIKIDSDVTVGAQPSEHEITALKDKGFKSVFNLRTSDEPEQPLTPEAEGKIVEDAGLGYEHIPVPPDDMDESQVESFREKFTAAVKPAYVHCKSGKRAGAFVMMHQAVEQGMSGEEALAQAEKLGFECDEPAMKEFVTSYVDGHTAGV